MELAILIVSGLAVVLLTISLLVILKKKDSTEKLDEEKIWQVVDTLQDNILGEILKEIDHSQKAIIENTKTIVELTTKYQDKNVEQIKEIKQSNKESIEKLECQVRASVNDLKNDVKESLKDMNLTLKEQIENMSKINEKKLDEMRNVVDEKLTNTLNERITAAFKQVIESLNTLQKGFLEVEQLTKQVGGLNKVLNNVKSRGIWGEVALENLLSQTLTEEQYYKQYAVTGSREKVDFAIKMPGKNKGEEIFLPIDAKFPLSDFERYVDYIDSGEYENAAIAKKELYKRIKQEAKSIRTKYIDPPKTTDFAIMYLPTEGLYSEIVKDPVLCEELQNNYRIVPCGPTVLGALLNSLQVGFNTLKIQKSSFQVVDLMKAFQKDFAEFVTLTQKIRKHAEDVVKSIDEVDKKNANIIKKLQKVDLIDMDNEKPLGIEGIIENNDK